VPEGYTHSYWCYTCRLDTDKLGLDWRAFRRQFVKLGGDGLYGVWCPVHLEPVFRALSFYGTRERAPHYDPRYRGKVKGYHEGDCPDVEAFRTQLCLFKTGMQNLDKVRAQVDALQAVIRHYG
jgi:hypothetical protein